jgi:hypothetical protein
MPVVRYTARRSLVSPTVANDTVTYDLPLVYAGMTRARVPNVVRHRSLTGAQEAYYQSAQESWDCVTRPLFWATGTTVLQARYLAMFLDSVESGESFEFDPDHKASDGGAIVYRDVVIDSQGYQEPRVANYQTLFSYTFRIITVP